MTTPARPTPQQLAFAELELGMFCHYGMETYLDASSRGQESPEVFRPTALDPRQWARAAREAGMNYLVFIAKSHDGFCLWPTDTTDYSVRACAWQEGRGDVVELVAEACAAEGIKLGLYCSPVDWHEPRWADEAAYDDFYLRQWEELLSRYGPVLLAWLDLAHSHGHHYDWQRIQDRMRELQPDLLVHSLGEPDYRSVSAEDGLAPDPCWNTMHTPEEAYDWLRPQLTSRYLDRFPHWLTPETDVTIRANWFWRSFDEPTLKRLDQLMEMYYRGLGHGANLLVNLPADPSGLLPEPDLARLAEWTAEIRRRFGRPLATAHGPAAELEVRFPQPTPVNHVIAQEDLTAGEAVREYVVSALVAGTWQRVYRAEALGHKRIARLPTVLAEAVRLEVTSSEGLAVLRSLAAYRG